MKVGEKGASVALSYGVEAFAPNKHMVKEDGKTSLKSDDKAMFKVIEFNKDQRKIVVSHIRIHEEKAAQTRSSEHVAKEKDREEGAKAVKKVKESVEKTTLGDLGVLSNLKTEMEAAEKKKGDDTE
jgi:small subunit ribosomal protein S1